MANVIPAPSRLLFAEGQLQSPTVTKVSPLAIENNARSLTAFERMNKISLENENSSH